MIKNFIEFIFLYSFFFFSAIGYGSLILNKLNIKNFYFGLSGIVGLFFYAFVITFLHFFIAISPISNLIILLFGLFIFFKNNHKIKFKKFKFNFEIFLIIILATALFFMFWSYKPHEDFGYYHLPYIKAFLSQKIIFGFVNILEPYLWNSMFLNLSSIFVIPIFNLKGIFLTPLLFFFFFILILLNEVFINFKNKKYFYPSILFSLIILFYFLLKFTRASEYGVDIPSHIVALLAILYFIKFFEIENISTTDRYNYTVLIFLLSIFSLTIKVSNSCVLIFFFSLLFLNFKYLNFKKIFLPFSFIFFFGLLWLIQQFIYSGCLLFPLNFTCIDTIWSSKENIKNILLSLEITNKSFGVYKGTLSETEYIKNFNWFQNWFARNKIEFLEHFATFLIAPLFLLFINFFKNDSKINILNIKSKAFYISIIFFILISFIIWVLKSPVARFAISFFIVAIFYLIYFFTRKKFHFRLNYKTVLITILICLTFNLSKNFSRIFQKEDLSNFWPKIYDNKFITINKLTNNLYQNSPNSKFNSGHQGILCWNINFICSYKIEKLKYNFYSNYLIIKK
jgi:hypothetical protein